MIPTTFLTKNWKLILLTLVSVGCIIYVIFREGYIAQLELQTDAYDARIEQLEADKEVMMRVETTLRDSIEVKNTEIDTLRNQLHKIPTDNEVQENNPVVLLDGNSEWDGIIRANEMADDTTFFQF